ncbi:MAG: hypothetical protein AB7O39_10170 [Flavobacteriaceae bacterium]
MKDESSHPDIAVAAPLSVAVAGAVLLLGAAGILWYGHGAAVALAMMTGDAFLNCF